MQIKVRENSKTLFNSVSAKHGPTDSLQELPQGVYEAKKVIVQEKHPENGNLVEVEWVYFSVNGALYGIPATLLGEECNGFTTLH